MCVYVCVCMFVFVYVYAYVYLVICYTIGYNDKCMPYMVTTKYYYHPPTNYLSTWP